MDILLPIAIVKKLLVIREDVLKNIREAIELYLGTRLQSNWNVRPTHVTSEIYENFNDCS